MPQDGQPVRRSPRAPTFDYTTPGAYFVTVVCQGRRALFGAITANDMKPSEAGAMIRRWWQELPNKFSSVRLDSFVVMPNHIHGLLWLLDEPPTTSRISLPRVFDWFKTMTTNGYIRRCQAARLAALRWAAVAKKLLRARDAAGRRSERHPAVHHGQSDTLVGRPREPGTTIVGASGMDAVGGHIGPPLRAHSLRQIRGPGRSGRPHRAAPTGAQPSEILSVLRR